MDIYGNSVSHGNFYTQEKIFIGLGNDLSLGYVSDISKVFLYGTPIGVGINTTTPNSVLDIQGDQTHLLNVQIGRAHV